MCIRDRFSTAPCLTKTLPKFTAFPSIPFKVISTFPDLSLIHILNREKILRGLVKACEKRPVSMDRLDRAVEEIISELHRDHLREVPSSEIGKKVIEKLLSLIHI